MEKEGVIKYQLAFRNEKLAIAPSVIESINVCRAQLSELGLIGQDDDRYEGYGFGNISLRPTLNQAEFLISGTQTGHLPSLDARSLSYVELVEAEKNRLTAKGDVQPSSEGMTHGVLYQLSGDINAVVHVHSPDIWRRADALALAATAPEIPYGTVQMAKAVTAMGAELLAKSLPFIFVMKGHEDGVVVAGRDLTECTELLLQIYKRAKI